MVIYKAKKWFDKIEVEGIEIEKETEKTYKVKNGRINKIHIGKCDTYGYGYGLNKEEAVNAVRKHLESEITGYKEYIKRLEEVLKAPIEVKGVK